VAAIAHEWVQHLLTDLSLSMQLRLACAVLSIVALHSVHGSHFPTVTAGQWSGLYCVT
jgi:hypothetical protein